jgi:hypothetical protein
MFSSGAFSTAPFASESAFGVEVLLTGVQATGAVGSVTVSAGLSIEVTGVQATGAVGSVTVEQN